MHVYDTNMSSFAVYMYTIPAWIDHHFLPQTHYHHVETLLVKIDHHTMTHDIQDCKNEGHGVGLGANFNLIQLSICFMLCLHELSIIGVVFSQDPIVFNKSRWMSTREEKHIP